MVEWCWTIRPSVCEWFSTYRDFSKSFFSILHIQSTNFTKTASFPLKKQEPRRNKHLWDPTWLDNLWQTDASCDELKCTRMCMESLPWRNHAIPTQDRAVGRKFKPILPDKPHHWHTHKLLLQHLFIIKMTVFRSLFQRLIQKQLTIFVLTELTIFVSEWSLQKGEIGQLTGTLVFRIILHEKMHLEKPLLSLML